MSAIDFLRDIGKHFRVNKMITKEAVAARLHSRAGHLLHRVQLPAAAGPGLPRAVPAARLHAADRRQRPVGQPHRRPRPDPPRRARAGPRVRHAAGDQGRRHQVRQDRGRRVWLDPALTSPYAFYQFWLNTDDRDVVHLPEGASRSAPGPRSRRWRRRSRERPQRARRSGRWPRSSPRWCTGPRSATPGRGRQPGAVRPRRARRPRRRRRCAASLAELPRPSSSVVDGCAAAVGRRPVRRDRAGAEPVSAARRAIAEGGAYLNNVRVDRRGRACPGRRPAGRRAGCVLRRGKRTPGGGRRSSTSALRASDSGRDRRPTRR